ncbi:Protein SERAC1 [Fusarium austroafricanum]|uniref:Protein SERAC1 n=1 Tax=Fusarium austroafricanum TaxID=2364996 RepID=A0A8H4P2M8_9HYPO|nr:Protein SERAC1 [Fusarium austroafricanum]
MFDHSGPPMMSAENLAKIKRSYSPWNPANKPKSKDSEPARIVSDIVQDPAVKPSAAGFLSSNPQIQAAQSVWERSQAQSLARQSSTGSSQAALQRPPQERNSPSDLPPAKRQNNTEHRKSVRQRFTEYTVAKELNELNNAAVKKGAMPQSQAMHFATGSELLKRFTDLPSPPPMPTQSPDVPGSQVEAIILAEPGRAYSLYPKPGGGTTSARGCLIPPNYKLHDDPDLQFVCPVRDCRRLFSGLKGLGGHFGASHCLSTFNDNGDGTLSKVGAYQKGGPGGTPGIVVSRNPLPPDAPPPVAPGLSYFASIQQGRMSRDQRKATRSQANDSSLPPLIGSENVVGPMSYDVKDYLHQHLSPAQKSHQRDDINFMLTESRKRDLPESWRRTHRGSDLDIIHYACALAYLTGKVVTGSEQCTVNTTRQNARLSHPCIALPPMPPAAKRAFSDLETCVGCKYWCHLQGRPNGCDWCPAPGAEGTPSCLTSLSDSEANQEMDIDSDDIVEQYPGSGNLGQSTKEALAALGVVKRSLQMGGEFEMEDWEIAPGRMTDDSSDNIAFSNSYLTSGQPVTVSEDVRFNVIVLKPGSSKHWNVEDDKLRTCSVASGKVRVKMGEKTFNLGPNGMFVVRPGQACKVENRLYLDSVVHTETAPEMDSAEPELSNDKDSTHVNPGSPPSQLPPLNDYTTKSDAEVKTEVEISEKTSEVTDVSEKVSERVEKTSEEISEKAEEIKARFIIDPAGELTHDQTTVDIVTVPCPGADPLRTWSRDGLMGRYFGALSMRDAEGAAEADDRPVPSWVRQGLRREADVARILLYEHPTATEGMKLSALADALLDELAKLRQREKQTRPVVFVGHSIGGIIVKMALTKAHRDPLFEDVYRQCYGVAFFGTPHQGSSYFAMPSLATGIQSLLQLSVPLPTSITDDLRVGNRILIQLDDDFKLISHEFRIWTLYETIDSRLSGNSGDVYFTAPLTSIKSAILGMRQETILPLQSDHANIASFGRHNVHTMRLFLKQLSALIGRADEYSREDGNWHLNLEQKVNVEVHGFFEDPPSSLDAGTIRAWSTRLALRDFLRKGPEECLAERLNEVEAVDEGRFLRNRGKATFLPTDKADEAVDNPLGISQGSVQVQPPSSPVIRPVDAEKARSESAPHTFATPATPLSPAVSPPTHYSTPMRRPSPLIRANFEQDLAVDRLSPPPRGRMGRSLSRSVSLGTQASQYEYRDFPPFSPRSRSTIEGFSEDDDDIEASPKLPEAVIAIRKAANDGERRASETVIVDEVPVAFSKPQVEARKFLWIHLPYNNPRWVTKIFETLQTVNSRNYAPLFNNDFWATRHTRGRHAQHYAYFAKPGCYFSAPRHSKFARRLNVRANNTVSRGRSSMQSSISPTPGGGTYTCLFLPYLHFDSYKRLIRRRELILQRLQHGRARPVPESVAKSDSLEAQIIWEYLGYDPPLNCRRTLDQYGYPSLRDTRSRDDDQMLYKLTKERSCIPGIGPGIHSQMSNSSSGSSGGGSRRSKTTSSQDDDNEEDTDVILNGNVLMVDQLWLWAIDSHTLLSFFPKREGDAIEGPLYQQADLRDSIFNEVNVDLTRQCENALDLAALAVLHAVTVLLDRSSHPDLEVFRIFEEAISVLTEKLTSSLKTFRAEGFRDKATAYEPVENKAQSIRARHKAEGRRAEEDNRDNTSALLELRDIEDELLILLHLFEQQSKVVSSMLSTYARPELRDRTGNGRLYLSEAIKKLSEYAHQAQEMIERVRSTRDDYDKLLQMVQRQAQVDEVRLSRLHADLASAQSRSVMIFTIFTVIFLPLSFFTSLFGMNTREWGGEKNLPLRTIGTISLPASFLLVVTALVAAWSTSARLLLKLIVRAYRLMMSWIWKKLCRPVGAKMRDMLPQRKERQREEREPRSGRAGLSEEVSDFWERHRLERESGYTVPEKNKKTVSMGVSKRPTPCVAQPLCSCWPQARPMSPQHWTRVRGFPLPLAAIELSKLAGSLFMFAGSFLKIAASFLLLSHQLFPFEVTVIGLRIRRAPNLLDVSSIKPATA